MSGNITIDHRKSLINLKREQSNLMEEAEAFRQLILSSAYLKPDKILKLDAALDAIVYNMSVAYDTKICEYDKIGNI